MSTIANYKKIPKDVATGDDLDFDFLRKSGIAYIESLGGGLWSDLNDHDPGVSFLELISYAITDLGMRLDLPIADILAQDGDPYMSNQFYTAEQILPTCPVNPLDYRKLFLDIDGIRNCWMLPYEKLLHVDCVGSRLSYEAFPVDEVTLKNQRTVALQGLNCVLVDYEEEYDDGTPIGPTEKDSINAAICAKYQANRNLCEDLAEIKEIGIHKIGICTTIELERNADENKVHAMILDGIQQYFNTSIARHTLKAMLAKGYRTDEIFEGPFLEKGFIDTKELKAAELRTEVRLSDIVNIIMKVEGVKVIADITIQDCDAYKSGKDWLICIHPMSKPVLAPTSPSEDPECTMQSVFNYKKDVIPVLFNSTLVEEELDKIIEARNIANTIGQAEMLLAFPFGNVTDVSDSTTIQNDLPETYGIGPYGLPSTSTTARRAQALQLKGYLSFFDQVLASYFAHLGKVKELLSFNSGTAPTYFTQAIQDIKNFDQLVNNYPLNDDVLLTQNLMSTFDNNIERRNEFLDHLLARFAEDFSEYAFLMKEMYGMAADTEIIESKEQFLQEYVELSRRRGKGYNCAGPDVWDTSNISGVQKQVARKAGMVNYNRRHLWTQYVTFSGTYNWSIKDALGNVILNSPGALTTQPEAQEQLCFAMYQLQNTFKGAVSNTSTAIDGDYIGNIRINVVGANYSFSVIDTNDPLLPVLATGGSSFATWNALKTYILEILRFIQDDFVEEGIFLVEHILLRPADSDSGNPEAFLPICVDDCASDCQVDPYSFRVSVVLPGMNRRFASADFRKFMESLIQREMPSHIIPRICWIGMRSGPYDYDGCELPCFEDYWKTFLEMQLDRTCNPDPGAYNTETLINLHQKLTKLHTIYPAGRLHDCENTDFEQSIILGRSTI